MEDGGVIVPAMAGLGRGGRHDKPTGRAPGTTPNVVERFLARVPVGDLHEGVEVVVATFRLGSRGVIGGARRLGLGMDLDDAREEEES